MGATSALRFEIALASMALDAERDGLEPVDRETLADQASRGGVCGQSQEGFERCTDRLRGGYVGTSGASQQTGSTCEFTAKLAKKGINIDAAYGTVPKGAKKSVLYFATSKQAGG